MATNVIAGKMVRIGNSKGIRIPKVVREQLGLDENIEMEIVDGSLVVRPKKHPRDGWEESFKEMAANGDDELIWPDYMQHDFDDNEWEW